MKNIRLQQVLMYGVTCAVIVMVVNLIFYATDFIYMWGGMLARISQGLIFVGAFIALMISWKKKQDEISYKEAFLYGLAFLGVHILIMFAYEFCFYQFLAPDFYQTLMDRTLQMMVDFNVPENQLEETRRQFEEGRKNAGSVTMSSQGALVRLVSDVIILAIVAIFLRKKKSEELS